MKNKNKLIFSLIILLTIILVGGSGYYAYTKYVNRELITKSDPNIDFYKSFSIEVLKEGKKDAKIIEEGDLISIVYVGRTPDGNPIDASSIDGLLIDDSNPLEFIYQKDAPDGQSVIKGWIQGLDSRKEGDIIRLKIPASLAYGEKGNPPLVKPNYDLTFDMRILSITKASELAKQEKKRAEEEAATSENENDNTTEQEDGIPSEDIQQ